MKTLLKNNFVELSYYAGKKLLIQKWTGYIEVDSFKKAIDEVMAASSDYTVEKILSDTRDQAILKREATDYAASKMPELIKRGLKKMAFLLPESAFTKLSVNHFAKKANSEVIQFFSGEKEAEEWLFKL